MGSALLSLTLTFKQIMDLGPGALLAKIDIKSAYRIIPVHPSDRPLLGMSFQRQVYIDASLPFGLRKSSTRWLMLCSGY